MELKIQIVEIAPENYAIQLTIEGSPDLITPGDTTIQLQQGYRTPRQALEALIDVLTFAPPDMGMYDEAVSKVSELIDHKRDAEEAITQLHTRVQDCEDAIQTLQPATAQPRVNRLLAGRSPTPAAPAVPDRPASPPPIRRQSLGAGTRAGMIAGGVARGRHGGEPPPEVDDL